MMLKVIKLFKAMLLAMVVSSILVGCYRNNSNVTKTVDKLKCSQDKIHYIARGFRVVQIVGSYQVLITKADSGYKPREYTIVRYDDDSGTVTDKFIEQKN